jgi:S1-C subfamily serine protease
MQPDAINAFTFERRLGSGSFATVWLAHDRDLDAKVAIKVLAENWSAHEEVRRRFLQEARFLWRLNHERVVGVHATGTTSDGRPYFVMDYADRGSLEDKIRQRRRDGAPFSVAEAIALGRELAECLAVIHDVDIIHRDIKPSNILFRSTPRPDVAEPTEIDWDPAERMLLADFGIARLIASASAFTVTAGTSQYMAPEQADPGSAGQADQRADLYSATVILFELLAQQVPFPYDSYSEVLRAKLTRPPLPLRSLRADVPAELEGFIARGLNPDPAQRYASAREWGQALYEIGLRLGIADSGTQLRAQPSGEPQLTVAWSAGGLDAADAGAAPPPPPLDPSMLGDVPGTPPPVAHAGTGFQMGTQNGPVAPPPATYHPATHAQAARAGKRLRLALVAVLLAALTLGAAGAGRWAGSRGPGQNGGEDPQATAVSDNGKLDPATATATASPTVTPTATSTATPTPTGPQVMTTAEVLEHLEPSTVMIVATVGDADGDASYWSGTGFIYDASGLVMTAAHVIEGAAAIEVYYSGNPEPVSASILGRSTCDDLAVLEIDGVNLPAATLGDAGDLRAGDDVYAIGYPRAEQAGEQVTITRGIVGRLGVDADIWDDAIQIDAALNPGNSGGPLVDAYGRVVGINVGRSNPDYAIGMNYAVSIETALGIVAELESGQDVTWLGAELVENSDEMAAEYGLPSGDGMVVVSVTPGGPAEEAGLQVGDVILSMEGLRVTSMAEVCDVVRTHAPRGFPHVTLAEADQGDGGDGGDGEGDSDDQSGASTLVEDTFDDGTASNWAVGTWDDYAMYVQSGQLTVEMYGTENAIVDYPAHVMQLADGAIGAEVLLEGDGMAGLIARYTLTDEGVSSMYLGLIDSTGQFALYKKVNGEWIALVDFQSHGAVRIGAPNVLVLGVVGGDLIFTINGETVAEVTDGSLGSGAWGIYVGADVSGFKAHFNVIVIDAY